MAEHDGHRERLRQRFLTHGLEPLQDHEVLELLLFYAIPRRDTNAIARKLLSHFGSISAVLDAPMQELQAVAGIGENAATLLELIAPLSRRYMLSRTECGTPLNSIKAWGEYLIPYFFGVTQEQIYLLCLDAKWKVLACRMLQEGSGNSVYLPIRKAAEIAMNCNANSVVLAHNHPCGLATPSGPDYATTDTLVQAFEPLGIRVADHIIVANNQFVSLRASGYLRD